ncbi:MAG: RelA/SpoT domain-containing protein [Blautia sp.]|nr:RelA/SpoT domain-containing protein [Blautia sp.]
MADIEQRTLNFLKWYEENEEKYSDFAQYVLEKVLDALNERAMLHAYHSSRAKKLASLMDKCAKKIYDEGTKSYILKYNDPRNQITDLAGVRIVCYLPQDVVPVQRIVENMFDIDKDNSNDKIDFLKSDKVGYLSVHYIISLKETQLSTEQRKYRGMKCEIQLRTVLQDA